MFEFNNIILYSVTGLVASVVTFLLTWLAGKKNAGAALSRDTEAVRESQAHIADYINLAVNRDYQRLRQEYEDQASTIRDLRLEIQHWQEMFYKVTDIAERGQNIALALKSGNTPTPENTPVKEVN